MKTIKTARLDDGGRVWLETDGFCNWIFFEDDGEFDETSGAEVPADSLDFRYTHGGRQYREACQKLGLV